MTRRFGVRRTLIKPKRRPNQLATTNGVMDKGNWSPDAINATVTNPSSGVLRVAATAANGYGRQFAQVIGTQYVVTGEGRTNGSTDGLLIDDNAQLLYTITSSTTWQAFKIVYTALATDLRLNCIVSGEYSEWRNLYLEEV